MPSDDSSPPRDDARVSLYERLNHPEIRDLIRKTARSVLNSPGFQKHEAEDLEQQLTLELLRQGHRYDPARGPLIAFVRKVLKTRAANLKRDRLALLRRSGPVWSLDVTVSASTSNDPGPLGATIAENQQHHPKDQNRRTLRDLKELQLDLHAVLAKLLPEERELLEELQHAPVSEVARRRGIAPSTLKDRVHKYCEPFENAGLRKYLA